MRIFGHAMHTQASAALAAGLIAIPVAAATGHPVASRTAPAVPSHRALSPRVPALAISVTDGRAAATTGDRLTYTVSVRDTGTKAAPHLTITQTLSPGLKFVSASGGGVVKAGQVAWTAALPAKSTRTFRVTALVTRPPARTSRLAAVACVTLRGGSRPVVCAAHLDRLPAAATKPAAAGSGSSGSRLLAYAGGGLAVLVAGLLAVIAGRRLRLRRRPG
jgi:uncharacterized repeat protein (TIGR01451 family)